MTNRDFYQTVLDFASTMEATDSSMTFEPTNATPAELYAKAAELLSKLDEKNAKRKTTETKEQKAAKERYQLVAEFLNQHKGESFTRDAIAEAVGISPAQAQAACKALGISKTEAKIDKVKRVVYFVTE